MSKKRCPGRKLFDGKNYETVVRKLCTAWARDCTDSEAAAFAGISKAALSGFLKNNPLISEQKERLKQTPVLKARETLHRAIEEGDAGLALKYLERKLKEEFSPLRLHAGEFTGKIEPVAPDVWVFRDDIAGINAAIEREITEIRALQKSMKTK